MDISGLLSILNSGIPSEALGGLTAHGVLTLINKIKTYFHKEEAIKEEEVLNMLSSNRAFKIDLEALENALGKNTTLMIGEKNNKVDINMGTINF